MKINYLKDVFIVCILMHLVSEFVVCNEIQMFTPFDMFYSFNTTYLDISYRRINEIPEHAFYDFPKLLKVDISHKKIVKIDVDAFSPGARVQMLGLSFNNISSVTSKMFDNLIELKVLCISNNQLQEIPSFIFHKMANLQCVDFSFNQIDNIHDFAFFGDYKLHSLNLAHNQLKSFDARIGENVYLKRLDISWNQITELNPNNMKNLAKLKKLSLAGNPLHQLNKNTFMDLSNLEALDLTQTSLSEIEPGTFSMLNKLRYIVLNDNNIKRLDENSLPSWSPHVYIRNNPIEELKGFKIFTDSVELLITYNYKFNCTDHNATKCEESYFNCEQICTPNKNEPDSDDWFSISDNVIMGEYERMDESGPKPRIAEENADDLINQLSQIGLFGVSLGFTVVVLLICFDLRKIKKLQTTQTSAVKNNEKCKASKMNDIINELIV
ncbi:toll-like receptor 7 [Contarinia nasturtii]|uniref:toll-like receptor 7 n=1 Tax=Contarinia nasturtii TaxID=265458 RepID=UPI0012D3793E|nr:toll-like receptor 7 [Contarinia nasturtii]